MEVIAVLFILAAFGFFERQNYTGFSNLGKLAEEIVRGMKLLEEQRLKEAKAAIVMHRDEIIIALEKKERFITTLPCAYRLIITGTREEPKAQFDPCSENMVV